MKEILFNEVWGLGSRAWDWYMDGLGVLKGATLFFIFRKI